MDRALQVPPPELPDEAPGVVGTAARTAWRPAAGS